MKKDDSDLVQDVEELLEETVLAEASQAVWQAFQMALGGLDPESRRLLELHFEGKTASDLGSALELPEKEVNAWILKSKRQVLAAVSRKTFIRQ